MINEPNYGDKNEDGKVYGRCYVCSKLGWLNPAIGGLLACDEHLSWLPDEPKKD